MREHPLFWSVFIILVAIPLLVFTRYAPDVVHYSQWLTGAPLTYDEMWIKAITFPVALVLLVVAGYVFFVYDFFPEAARWADFVITSAKKTTETLNYETLRNQPPEMYSFLKARLYTHILSVDKDSVARWAFATHRGPVPMLFISQDFLAYHNPADPLELKPMGHRDYAFNKAYSKYDDTPKYLYAQWVTEFCCMPVGPGFTAWAYSAKGNKAAHWYSVESHLEALEFFGIEADVKELA